MKTTIGEPGSRRTSRARRIPLACIVVLLLLAAASGCGSSRQPVRTRMVPYTPEQIAARDQAKEARYRIRAGDVLQIAFQYEPDLNRERILVLPDGYISLPGIGSVRAAGRTIPELDSHLNELYGREYRNPDLSLVIVEVSTPEVYVMGNVEHPGLYKLPAAGTGVMQAIAAAGGFTRAAEKSNVAILRAGEDGFVIRTHDLSHIEDEGIMDLTYFDLRAYDIVYVPQSKLGDLGYLTKSIFGSAGEMADFFWDIYGLVNIDKIDRLVR